MRKARIEERQHCRVQRMERTRFTLKEKPDSATVIDAEKPILNNYLFELVVIFLFFMVPLIIRYAFSVPDMDEIWNYQFARRILYGQIPYKDFYMLQTPFSAQVNALFLQLFSDKLIVLRIVGVFINSLNGVIIYLILRNIRKSIFLSFVTVSIFFGLVFLYPQNNYSWYAILFLSISLLLELRKINDNENSINKNWYDMGTGIFLGLATITKQNIGILGITASFTFLFYYYAIINKNYKEQYFSVKEKLLPNIFISIALKSFGWIGIVGTEILYLRINGALNNFIDQTIISAGTFFDYCSLPYSSLFYSEFILFKILAVLMPLAMITLLTLAIFRKQPCNQKKTMMLIFLYSFVNFSTVFPIADPIHLILAMPLPVICFMLLFNQKTPKQEDNIMASRFITLIFMTMIGFIAVSSILNMGSNNSVQNIKHYENIPLPNEAVETLKKVDEFIIQEENSGKQIYFLNYRAAFYLIPLDKFNYKFDITFYGNMGSNGEEEMIEKLSSSSNIIVLIKGENMLPNRQETKGFETYVRTNMNYMTSVKGFDAYTR